MKISGHAHAATGFGYMPPWEVNTGFVAGDSKTLIVDTGPNRFAAQTLYGYAISVRPQNQMFAVNTERHLDHMGATDISGRWASMCSAMRPSTENRRIWKRISKR